MWRAGAGDDYIGSMQAQDKAKKDACLESYTQGVISVCECVLCACSSADSLLRVPTH